GARSVTGPAQHHPRRRPRGGAVAPAVACRGTFGRPGVRPRGPGPHGPLGSPDRRGGAGGTRRTFPRRRLPPPRARRPSLEAQAGLMLAVVGGRLSSGAPTGAQRSIALSSTCQRGKATGTGSRPA